VGKANGSRECAPDDRLRMPTIHQRVLAKMVGTLPPLLVELRRTSRFAHPTKLSELAATHGSSWRAITTTCGYMSCTRIRRMFALLPAVHRAIRQHKSLPHQITIQQSDLV